jgi:hypothetical protein
MYRETEGRLSVRGHDSGSPPCSPPRWWKSRQLVLPLTKTPRQQTKLPLGDPQATHQASLAGSLCLTSGSERAYGERP